MNLKPIVMQSYFYLKKSRKNKEILLYPVNRMVINTILFLI